MGSLDLDCLSHVLIRLPLDDRHVVKQVGRHWNRAAQLALLFPQKSLIVARSYAVKEDMCRIDISQRSFVNLSQWRRSGHTTPDLSQLQRLDTHIIPHDRDEDDVDEEGEEEVVEREAHLHVPFFVRSVAESLVELRVYDLFALSSTEPADFLRLRSLRIGHCMYVDEDMLIKWLPVLKGISCDGSPISRETLSQFSKDMKVVAIGSNDETKSMTDFIRFKKVEKLEVSIEDLDESFFGHFPYLKRLRISTATGGEEASKLTDKGLEVLCSTSPLLQVITLGGCFLLTDKSLLALSQLTQLNQLELPGLPGSKIDFSLEQLKHLLSSCHKEYIAVKSKDFTFVLHEDDASCTMDVPFEIDDQFLSLIHEQDPGLEVLTAKVRGLEAKALEVIPKFKHLQIVTIHQTDFQDDLADQMLFLTQLLDPADLEVKLVTIDSESGIKRRKSRKKGRMEDRIAFTAKGEAKKLYIKIESQKQDQNRVCDLIKALNGLTQVDLAVGIDISVIQTALCLLKSGSLIKVTMQNRLLIEKAIELVWLPGESKPSVIAMDRKKNQTFAVMI